MHSFERPVRFDEVDAASIVFFGNFNRYVHEAMEGFFGHLEGGYSRLIVERRVGLPAVDVHMRFMAPLRYGDTMRIETRVARVGNRSATLSYRIWNTTGNILAAEIDHTVVTTDLDAVVSCPMPSDVRELLMRHWDPESGAPDAG